MKILVILPKMYDAVVGNGYVEAYDYSLFGSQ